MEFWKYVFIPVATHRCTQKPLRLKQVLLYCKNKNYILYKVQNTWTRTIQPWWSFCIWMKHVTTVESAFKIIVICRNGDRWFPVWTHDRLPPHLPSSNALTHTHTCLSTLKRQIKKWLAYSCQAFSISSVHVFDKCDVSSSLHEVVQGGWCPLNGMDIPLHSVL